MISSLSLVLAACFCTLAAIGSATLSGTASRSVLCFFLTLTGLLCLASGILGQADALILPLGLPWLPMHIRLDGLACFFLMVIGVLLTPVAIYSQGYLRHKKQLGALAVFMPLFVLGMIGVVVADDAFTFMLFWELMSVASYFLVTYEHDNLENRKAGFLYLLMAHLAGLLILGSFAVLYASSGSFEFTVMREAQISPFWASVAFLFAAVGFGTKAGVVPMHGWLPDAHPVAPSNISALMSGIMLKVAIFGFMRVVWDLMGSADFLWWWGALVLTTGASSAVFGVLMALQQSDLKRLLAYSSIENVGIILIGLGLAMLLAHFDHPLLAALGLIAALYHAINHALFKGLLFMGAGAILHSTGSKNMEGMGGLIHRMPWTAIFFLIGCLSISGLPPFNGFVSEWLIFQTALMAPQLGGALLTAMVPFSATMLALAGALAAACFVKVFGVVFLGHARSDAAQQAQEVDVWMKIGMAIPALLCLLFGLLPTVFIPLMDHIPQALLHVSIISAMDDHGWLWLAPMAMSQASYSAPIVLLGMLALGGVAFWLLHPKGANIRRSVLWSCGNPHTHVRMQYTAASFAQPLRRIFQGFYQADEHEHAERPSHKLLSRHIRHVVHVGDMAVKHVYQPLGNITLRAARLMQREHQRSINAYLTWIFATIIFLLAVFA